MSVSQSSYTSHSLKYRVQERLTPYVIYSLKLVYYEIAILTSGFFLGQAFGVAVEYFVRL